MGSVFHSFLGCCGESGFCSLYEPFISEMKKVFIIKGGPGTGKSTLMKKIAAKAQEQDSDIELIHCSSDPDSLDGIYLKNKGLCVLDGTPPHIIEPPYPGAVGNMIDLYKFWDTDFLSGQEENIRKISTNITQLYERAYLYIGAAAKLQRDLNKIGLILLNKMKFKGYFDRFCSKNIKSICAAPKESKRFLSAVTPNGTISYSRLFLNENIKTMVIEDEYGISSRALEIIRFKALKCNHTVICGYSPIIHSQLEHIVIPTANLAVCTSSSLHEIEPKPYCRINISRFFSKENEKQHKGKISFLTRARGEIISEAVNILKTCHSLHDELEEIYKTAVDFNALNVYTEKIINQILK